MSVQTQQIQNFAAGVDILREGYCSKTVYVLLQGCVQVTRLDANNRPVVLAELESGEVFGEMGLIANQPCSATVTAMGDVKVRCLDKNQFAYAMANNMKSVEMILGTLFKRMRQMNARVIELEGQLAASSKVSTPQLSSRQPEVTATLSGLTPQATHALGGLERMPITSFPFRIGRWGEKKKIFWLGSKEENDLDIHDVPPYGISKHHCRLEKKKGGIVLVDSSRLGTWVDDVMVDGQVRLGAGVHTLHFGATYGVFAFELMVREGRN